MYIYTILADYERKRLAFDNIGAVLLITPTIKHFRKEQAEIKFIKDDDEGILPYCEEEDDEKFDLCQSLMERFSWWSNNDAGGIGLYCFT